MCTYEYLFLSKLVDNPQKANSALSINVGDFPLTLLRIRDAPKTKLLSKVIDGFASWKQPYVFRYTHAISPQVIAQSTENGITIFARLVHLVSFLVAINPQMLFLQHISHLPGTGLIQLEIHRLYQKTSASSKY